MESVLAYGLFGFFATVGAASLFSILYLFWPQK